MMGIEVRDMQPDDEYFVGTCSHVNESEEADASSARRLAWLKERHGKGVRVKVGLVDGRHAGFAYLLPIELSPWGPAGRDLMVMPCLWVLPEHKGGGLGSRLVAAAEEETRKQGRKALVTYGYYYDFWFMPAGFFERLGFEPVTRYDGEKSWRTGTEAIIWKRLDESAEPPRFLERKYRFVPVEGRVAVDLFYNEFCGTSSIEAQRVREVSAEYGGRVVLREHTADDGATVMVHGIARGIFVDGKELELGPEVDRGELRKAIDAALVRIGG